MTYIYIYLCKNT